MMDSFTKRHVNALISKLHDLAEETKRSGKPPFVSQSERLAYENALRHAIKMRDSLEKSTPARVLPKGERGIGKPSTNQTEGD